LEIDTEGTVRRSGAVYASHNTAQAQALMKAYDKRQVVGALAVDEIIENDFRVPILRGNIPIARVGIH
jgi:hypothetical protein